MTARRAGRPRKPAAARDKGGKVARPAHAERQRDARSVAIEARVRLHGVSKDHAADQRAGYPIGRLNLAGVVSDLQFQAARLWTNDCVRWWVSQETNRPFPRIADPSAAHGVSTRIDDPEAYRRVMVAWLDAGQVVNRLGPRAASAIWATCIMEADERETRHMRGPLLDALTALVRHYGLGARSGGLQGEEAVSVAHGCGV